ncbi:hypothetical protein C8J57DRAFT_1396581, partial [Mycena rebaudengoi]
IVVDLFAYAEITGMCLFPRFSYVIHCPIPAYTFIMFLLTLYKCGITLHGNAHRVMPIWKLFLRDGVVWFLAVFAAGGSEPIIWTSKRETLNVHSTVASRAILNIKKIMSSESESDAVTLSYPDPIVFAPM